MTALSQNSFTYGSGGGFTPNITVSYGPVSLDVHLWNDDYGDLHNVIYREVEGAGILVVTLTADPGVRVTLNSFDLAGWLDTDYTINSVKVLDENGTALFSRTNVVIQGDSSGPRHTHFSFSPPLVASMLRIRVDSRNLGFSSENIGLDNIKFGQVGEPLLPHISSISPTSGPAGTLVTITGENFGNSQRSSTVAFDSTVVPQNNIISWSDMELQITVPSLADGMYNIVVTTSAGSSGPVVFKIVVPFLSLPLNVTCQGIPCTPYTARISAVIDHSVPTGYNVSPQ